MNHRGAGLWFFGRILLAASAALVLAACGDSGTGPGAGEPAQVTSVEPASGSVTAAVSTSITVSFSRSITLPGNGTAALWLEQGGQPVAGRLAQPDRRTLVFTPDDVLDPATPYLAHLDDGIRDYGGNPVAAASWPFTTAGAPRPSTSSARMLAHVAALADDSMNGRGSGTADELKAASYIAGEFSAYGLTPYPGRQWEQSFEFFWFGGQSDTSQNIIGVLAGEGSLKDEWIVVGGHYDHVGIRNGQIHNGADDNASGTAMVLELAQLLAQYARDGGFGAADRRSLMFIAFGAEEAGLVGSGYFCGYPFTPLATIGAMINLDMVGRLRGDTLGVAGWDTAPEWAGLFARYGAPQLVRYYRLGTDYRCFMSRVRPAVALFTGLHPDYHQPTDDVGLINGPGMQTIANLTLGIVANLAVRPTGLTWGVGE